MSLSVIPRTRYVPDTSFKLLVRGRIIISQLIQYRRLSLFSEWFSIFVHNPYGVCILITVINTRHGSPYLFFFLLGVYNNDIKAKTGKTTNDAKAK